MFTPKTPPSTLKDDLYDYLLDLEYRISDALRTGEFEKINFQPLAVAPDRPRQGDQIYADGTNYDPGSGEGMYEHNGTTYSKL